MTYITVSKNSILIAVTCLISSSFCVSNWQSKPELHTRLLEDDELDGQVTFHVHHSLESGEAEPVYVPRGMITVYPSREEATYMQDNPLSNGEVEKLKELVKNNGIYRVKLLSKPDEPNNRPMFSFTKACAIYESSLTDTLTVTMDQSGWPVGIAVSASIPYCTGEITQNPLPPAFNSSVILVSLLNGPAPDTLTYIQRLEQEKAEKARGEQGDNRSFFAKYWMYIVPFVIFLFISGASGPEGQAGGR